MHHGKYSITISLYLSQIILDNLKKQVNEKLLLQNNPQRIKLQTMLSLLSCLLNK